MTVLQNRRPLASRQAGWAIWISLKLAETRITPNQISIGGMVAALLAAVGFWAAGNASEQVRGVCLVLAAICVQLRLLCNLLDGMVAIESGRSAPDGGFWNEFPDRVSDLLILMGLALCVSAPILGWTATAFAFLTAYVRELGVNTGAGADFSGPMAKQHRMAVVTLAALVSVGDPVWNGNGQILWLALWVVIVGAAITATRRSWRLVHRLRQGLKAP
jgi:phosphatidylglycerophosphate synthase